MADATDTTDIENRLVEAERSITWLKQQFAIHATNTETALQQYTGTRKDVAGVTERVTTVESRVTKLEGAGAAAPVAASAGAS